MSPTPPKAVLSAPTADLLDELIERGALTRETRTRDDGKVTTTTEPSTVQQRFVTTWGQEGPTA